MVTAKRTPEGLLQPTMYTEGPRGLDNLNISAMRLLCREEYAYNGGIVTAIPRTTPTPTNDSHYFQHPSITYANTDIDKPEWYYLAHSPLQSWPINMLELYEKTTGLVVAVTAPRSTLVENSAPAVKRRHKVDRSDPIARDRILFSTILRYQCLGKGRGRGDSSS